MGTKKIQKPFDIEKWRNGAKIETKDGREARILCTDFKDEHYPIVAAIMLDRNYETIVILTAEGHYCNGYCGNTDLVIVEEVDEADTPEPPKRDYSVFEDTIDDMLSDDWRMRLMAEYCQLKLRRDKLKEFLVKYEYDHYGDVYKPDPDIDEMKRQLCIMDDYMNCLERRAIMANINLKK